MIYLVSEQTELFTSDLYARMSVEEAITTITDFDVIQFDTETTGSLKLNFV